MVAISRKKFKSCGNHEEFLARIKKTLYYGELPITERLSLPVTELASDLFSQTQYGKSLERLHCDVAADISLDACISPCSLVLAMLYLERLRKCNPEYLQRVAPSELFLVSLMVSTKFLTDEGEEDDVFIYEWAHSGNVTKEELLQLEKEFLNAIEWEVFVKENDFLTSLFKLEHDVALRQGKARGGWFTYTDLYHLIEDIEIINIFQSVLTVTTVLMASYTASILTIFGSVLLVSHVPGTSLYKNCDVIAPDNVSVPLINSTEPNESLNSTTTQENNLNILLEAIEKMQENETNVVKLDDDTCHKFTINPVNVLTTSFILASIQTNQSNDFKSIDTEHAENSTWDWWSNDLMQWLSSISKPDTSSQNVEQDLALDQSKRLIAAHDSIRFNLLVDQNEFKKAIHHTRIQDQLEQSWHKEWTESITDNYHYLYGNLLSYYGKIINVF